MKKIALLLVLAMLFSLPGFAHYSNSYYSFIPQSPVLYYYPKTPVYYYPATRQFGQLQPGYYYFYPNYFLPYYLSRTVALHREQGMIGRIIIQ